MMRTSSGLLLLLAACATTSRGGEGGGETAVRHAGVVEADTTRLEWRPSWPGTEMAIVKGDPFKGGEWAFQFRMPTGYWIHPHRHPVDAHIRVLSGAFVVGHGERLDSTRVQVLGPGRTTELKLGMPHFEGTRAPTVIEVHGAGVWGITFVDPDKDPGRPGGR